MTFKSFSQSTAQPNTPSKPTQPSPTEKTTQSPTDKTLNDPKKHVVKPADSPVSK